MGVGVGVWQAEGPPSLNSSAPSARGHKSGRVREGQPRMLHPPIQTRASVPFISCEAEVKGVYPFSSTIHPHKFVHSIPRAQLETPRSKERVASLCTRYIQGESVIDEG